MRRLMSVLLLAMLPLGCFAATRKAKAPANPVQTVSTTVPVSTKSEPARKLFEAAMVDDENLKTNDELEKLRRAIKIDPVFAQGYIMIARSTLDPAEQASARNQAKTLASKVVPGEQLLIRWMASAQENDLVAAIAAVNDLLAQYPKDKRLLFQASAWFLGLGAVEPALQLSERALTVDPNYCAALNEAGYMYAQTGQMDKAMAAMDKYISLLPNEPNPQDSYAELLRMAGRFNEALEHYRVALTVDSKFDSSQLGIGDTYLLMGEYEKARQNYAAAADLAPDNVVRLQYIAQVAQSYAREGNFDAADKTYNDLIERAHTAGLGALESTLLLNMALYQTDDQKAFALLDRAEQVLHQPSISASDRESRLAFVLRDRVLRASQNGNGAAQQAALGALKEMAESSRRDLVQQAFHLAMGASLIAEKKNGEAIEHLYENVSNPRALRLLVTAFENMKATSEATSVRKKLATVYEPTMEQAVAKAALGK